MQNQQTQQNPQNGAQPFFPMGQGPNNSDPHQIGSENNPNAPDPDTATRQGSEISSQIGGAAIGGAAIGGAAINGAATSASQAESPIPGVQEPLDTQTLPNAIDNATQESALNPEIGGMNTEAANIIPFPSPDSQAQKNEQNTDDQAATDGVNKIVPLNDALNQKDLPVIEKMAKEVEHHTSEAYDRIVDLRRYFRTRSGGSEKTPHDSYNLFQYFLQQSNN